jgi:oxalate decarboxylase/phosphoglucose isomerase-like protein (cupin superfamily)
MKIGHGKLVHLHPAVDEERGAGVEGQGERLVADMGIVDIRPEDQVR